MLKWLDTREVDELADSIVEDLRRRVPSTGLDLADKKTVDKAVRGLENLYSRIATFARAKRPNMYQKARFGNRVRWSLKEAGYPGAFVEAATHELVKYLAVTAAKTSA